MSTQIHQFASYNPALIVGSLIDRLRPAAQTMSHQQLADTLATAIQNALDADHFCEAERAYYGQASDEAEADCEYHAEQAAAWSVLGRELGLESLALPAH
jgi:hypothetical protein